ncbi:MAG: phosphate ABC transporter, permease protein PstA, partial [candidate division WOR-3 bacterium]
MTGNLSHATRRKSRIPDGLWFSLVALPLALFLAFVVYLVVHLLQKGASSLSWKFLTQHPSRGMTEGGILPCI